MSVKRIPRHGKHPAFAEIDMLEKAFTPQEPPHLDFAKTLFENGWCVTIYLDTKPITFQIHSRRHRK